MDFGGSHNQMRSVAGNGIQLARIALPQVMRGRNRRQHRLDFTNERGIPGNARNRLLVVRDLAQVDGQPVRKVGMREAFEFVHGLSVGIIEADPFSALDFKLMLTPLVARS